MNSKRAFKQWSFTKNETITTFEAWRQNLQYSLSLDDNFAPFLADNFSWLKKSSTYPQRGLTSDGEDVPTSRRRTANQKNVHLSKGSWMISRHLFWKSRDKPYRNNGLDFRNGVKCLPCFTIYHHFLCILVLLCGGRFSNLALSRIKNPGCVAEFCAMSCWAK